MQNEEVLSSEAHDGEDLGKVCFREAPPCLNGHTGLVLVCVFAYIFSLGQYPHPNLPCMSPCFPITQTLIKMHLSDSDSLVRRMFTVIICIYFFFSIDSFLRSCLHVTEQKFYIAY